MTISFSCLFYYQLLIDLYIWFVNLFDNSSSFSVLGGIFIVGGLYCVAWGKMSEVRVKQVQEEIDQSLQP